MIRLGYEIGTGVAVDIPLRHTAVTGQTQESGKTTTLEAIITRSGLHAVAFLTKRGEKSFRQMTPVPVYFREPQIAPETPMWKWIESIFETVGESVGREEKAAIIQASEFVLRVESYKKNGETRRRLVPTTVEITTLDQVAANVDLMLGVARGKMQTALTCLNAYFRIVIPQIARLKATRDLVLRPGVNVMDLESLTDEMQMLIIRSVIEEVYRKRKNIVVIVPESAKFIPRARQSPVRLAAEMFIRQGLGIGNVLMLDSQDLANVATEVLKSVGVWILGKQGEINEVKRVVNYIPANPKIRPEEVMRLGKGQFFAVFSGDVKKVYVQPFWVGDVHARAIALGEEKVETAEKIWKETKYNVTVTPGPTVCKTTDVDPRAPHQLLQTMEQTPDGTDIHKPELEEGRNAGIERELSRAPDKSGIRMDGDALRAVEYPGSQDSHHAEPGDESEDRMWREKYEALAESVDKVLRIVGDSNLMELREEFYRIRSQAATLPPNGHAAREVLTISEDVITDEIFADLRKRLLADPGVREALIASIPTLEIKIERPMLAMDSNSIKGRIARLIHEKFFDAPRRQADVLKEFKRRGWLDAKTGNTVVIRPMADITELGFLTIEDGGYQAVPGMRITVKES